MNNLHNVQVKQIICEKQNMHDIENQVTLQEGGHHHRSVGGEGVVGVTRWNKKFENYQKVSTSTFTNKKQSGLNIHLLCDCHSRGDTISHLKYSYAVLVIYLLVATISIWRIQ